MNKLVMSQSPSMDYIRGWNNAVSDMKNRIETNRSKAEQCLIDSGEYVTERHANWVESEGAYFCDDCIEDYFAPCEQCGELHRYRNMREVARRMLCHDCAEEAENETEN